MGTPNPIFRPGAACAMCWGPGGKFGVGQPPKTIIADIRGVTKGPLWIPSDGEFFNERFTLKQNPANGCLYEFTDPEVTVQIDWNDVFTIAFASNAEANNFFGVGFTDQCQDFFDSTITGSFEGGQMKLSIPGYNL